MIQHQILNLSGFFAVWEVVKFFAGAPAIIAAAKEVAKKDEDRDGFGCLILAIETAYMAWSVWLLFIAIVPALAMWALTFSAVLIRRNYPGWTLAEGRVNSAISCAILTLLFMGVINPG